MTHIVRALFHNFLLQEYVEANFLKDGSHVTAVLAEAKRNPDILVLPRITTERMASTVLFSQSV